MQQLLGTHLVKPEAVAELRSRLADAGLPATGDVRQTLKDVTEAFGPARYADVTFRASGTQAGDRLQRVHGPAVSHMRTPRFLNGRPSLFPEMEPDRQWEVVRPAFEVLRLPNATVRLIPDAPVAFDETGAVVDDFSSDYARLLYFYDRESLDPEAVVQDLPGAALVLIDDVWDLNYCHWISDWLPRLTALTGELTEAYVLTSPLRSAFQLETLAACGVSPDRVVPVEPWTGVKARELILPPNISDVRHPACKGAAWAVDFLRGAFSRGAGAASRAEGSQRLYLSRADAPGRRIVNEGDLEALLSRYGYGSVTLSGRTVADQAALFRSASHVIGMHGAGFTNIVFSNPGACLVEIFADTYGTLAFWVLAATTGKPYFTYVADRVVPGPRTQLDDVEIDLAAFERQVLAPLHGAAEALG